MAEILRVNNLKKYFPTASGMLHAVDDVSFSINEGQTLGVVGESGCGKSTLGRVLIRLIDATDGSIFFEGEEITNSKRKQTHELQKKMQMVFQDPFSSLNPRKSVMQIISDPLKAFHLCRDSQEMQARVRELMDVVGLASRFENSYPHEMDGGRRQRVGIARALACNPNFIVCDEPVSALDVSIQAQILNLLQDLQEVKKLTYVFITHDLSVVKHFSTDILVMYAGTMVEKCPTDELFDHPLHPYTKGLLSAIPVANIHHDKKKVIMQGEIVSPIEPKPGCRFAARCPFASEACTSDFPTYEEVTPGHFVACHNVKKINGLS